MHGIGRTMGLVVALGTLVGMALVLPMAAPSAGASPAPAAGGSTQMWAYGAERWANASVTLPNASYSLHAFFGWQVVLMATNTSATTVAVEADRTVGASLFASYCAPTCASPRLAGNLTFQAYEQDAGFANFTTNATVYENATPVAAVGILNASAESRAGVTENLSVLLPHNGSTLHAAMSLVATGTAHASVTFAPALGLVPWNVTPGAMWSSSTTYTAAGAWAFTWAASRTSPTGGTISAGGSPSGSSNATGTLLLAGQDLGTVTLNNGLTVPQIVLGLSGPFDDEEGFVFVPHAFDVFGGGAHPWDAQAVGAASFSTARVDLAFDAVHHHIRVVAGASNYAGVDSGLGPVGGMSTALQPKAQPAPSLVQAQPESVAQAQQRSGCLVSGCSSGGSSSLFSGLVGPVLVIGLLIGLLVGAVTVIEWRKWSKSGGAAGRSPTYPPIQGAPLTPGFGTPMPPPPPPPAGSLVGSPPTPPSR